LNTSFGPLVGNPSQFAFMDDALLVAILKLLNKHIPLFPGLLFATFNLCKHCNKVIFFFNNKRSYAKKVVLKVT
jgi:hypothetical protein